MHGTAVMLLGPSIATLHRDTGLGIARLGVLFSAVSAGYLLGVVVSGRLVETVDVHRVLAAGLVLMGAAVALVPHVGSLGALATLEFGVGAGIGLMEVPCNSAILWTAGGGALLNGLHAAFAVGAVLGPLVVGRSLVWTDGLTLGYSVVAVACVVPLFALARHRAPTNPHAEVGRGVPAGSGRLVAAITVFFFAYVGAEAGFGSWIYRYGELREVVHGDQATFLGAAFLTAFAIGRLSGVVLARHWSPTTMLHVDHAVTLTGLGVLALGGRAPVAVWVGTVVVGLGVASMFASMLGLAERLVTPTGTVTSIYLVGSSLGGMILAGSMGAAFDAWGARALPAIVGASVLVTWVVLTGLAFSARRRGSLASS